MNRLKTIIVAKSLRKEGTNDENILWQKLRNKKLGVKFRRQHPIDMFIVDFYAPSLKLVIELDGSPHTIKENKEYDAMRTDYLECKYVRVLRFWNSEVERNLEEILNKIKEEIKKLS